MNVLCRCERGRYESEQFSSCYECYLERCEEYEQCIFCSKWHSPRYHTCFDCRVHHHREEAGLDLKLAILMRDDFQCQRVGCDSRERPEIDHIFPCYEGGTADPWNLQVLCHACNKVKAQTWYYRSTHWERRVALMHRYFAYFWDWLDDVERHRLVTDASGPDYEREFYWRARLKDWLGQPLGNYPDEQDSHALAAQLGIDHETLSPIAERAA